MHQIKTAIISGAYQSISIQKELRYVQQLTLNQIFHHHPSISQIIHHNIAFKVLSNQNITKETIVLTLSNNVHQPQFISQKM